SAARVAMGAIRKGNVFPSTGMNGKRGDRTWGRSTRCVAPSNPVGAGSRPQAGIRTSARLRSRRPAPLFHVTTLDLTPPATLHQRVLRNAPIKGFEHPLDHGHATHPFEQRRSRIRHGAPPRRAYIYPLVEGQNFPTSGVRSAFPAKARMYSRSESLVVGHPL